MVEDQRGGPKFHDLCGPAMRTMLFNHEAIRQQADFHLIRPLSRVENREREVLNKCELGGERLQDRYQSSPSSTTILNVFGRRDVIRGRLACAQLPETLIAEGVLAVAAICVN